MSTTTNRGAAALPYSAETRSDLARRLFEHIENGTTDLADAVVTLDPSMYSDDALAARERTEIFANVPVMAAHGSEIAGANDFLTVQLPNNEVLLTRQNDGSVRGFVNMCRHRGARLVLESSGCKRIHSCGYHGWAYGADGGLRTIAHEKTFGEVDKAGLGLREVAVEERHGLVWVVDSTDPDRRIDVARWLGAELDAELAGFGLERYRTFRTQSFDEPVNWKLLMDAFVDGYHLDAVHAKTVAPYFYNNTQTWDRFGRHGRAVAARKSIDKVRTLPPAEAPIDPHVNVAVYVMPNLTLLRLPDHVELLNFLPHPHDTNAARMQMRILVDEDLDTEGSRSRWERNWEILMAVLRDEDLVLARDLQRAVRNGGAPTLVLGRNEVGNQCFHSWLQRALDDPEHWG